MLIGRYPALLDANVLHPAFVRSALLWFADERLFMPHWSADIIEEWRRSVRRRFPDVSNEAIDRTFEQMGDAYPSAEVTGYSEIATALTLPDHDDRHVLAAAIVGKCSGIITANLRDFPKDVVSRYDIEVIHPDDFIVNIIDLDEGRALAACRQHRAAMSNTTPTEEEYLDRYRRAGLIQAHGRLAPKVRQL